jgi:uncharacterized membrane protein (DUF4010 family)
MTAHDLAPFVTSLAIGLLLGFERERSHPAATRQAAGSRTFALVALAGTLAATIDPWVVAAGMLAVGAVVAIGYRTTSETDPGATTEIAVVVTYLLGVLAERDTSVAVTLAIIVVVILSAKSRLHTFARDVVTDADVDDAIKFLVMAFVVLPLLPDRSLGPYDVLNPQRIWLLVLALTGISWAGYVATRAFGARRGALVAGLAGGFISASATTATMGRTARSTSRVGAPLQGALVASIATFVQLAGIIAIADPSLLTHLWPALLAGAITLGSITLVIGVRDESSDADAEILSAVRPFGIWPALMLAGVLTSALLVSRWMIDVIGTGASVVAAGAAGLADAHAGALAVATLHDQGQLATTTALFGITAALGTNTFVKCVLAFVAGGADFGRRFAVGVVAAFAVFVAVVVVTTA